MTLLEHATTVAETGEFLAQRQDRFLAVSISAQSARWPEFWQTITVDQSNLLDSFVSAIAVGWQAKW